MDTETVELLLANRRYLYSLAARGYAEEPDATFVDVMIQKHTRDEVGLVCEDDDKVLSALEEALSFLDNDPAMLGELQRQYVEIFVGPGKLLADPWESMHITGRRVLFQQETLIVREFYRGAGFLPKQYLSVADDHIGLELDFLSKLASDALEANETGSADRCVQRLQESQVFLNKHLLRWIDSLVDAIEKGYGACFYYAFTKLISAVSKRDALIIDELLGGMTQSD